MRSTMILTITRGNKEKYFEFLGKGEHFESIFNKNCGGGCVSDMVCAFQDTGQGVRTLDTGQHYQIYSIPNPQNRGKLKLLDNIIPKL